jgi:exopolysaccharide production protein ExoQ
MNKDVYRQPGVLEKGFVVLALFFYSEAFIALFELKAGLEIVPYAFNWYRAIFSYPIYLVLSFLVIKYARDIFLSVKREKFIVCLVGLTILSILWSDFPYVTFKRSASLIGTSLFGAYIAVRYTLKEQLQLLAVMLGIAAVFSLLFTALVPSYGISSELYDGSWRGIYVHKNVFGRLMVFSAIVFTLLNVNSRRSRHIKLALLSLSLALLILSTSKTSLVVFVILLALLPVYKSLQWHFYLRVFLYCFFIVAVICTVTWLMNNTKFVLDAMGRDLTLTGRTELWEAVFVMIKKRPVLGYGYSAFWLGLDGKSEYVWRMVGWKVPHAHNGLLDLWLDVGLLGVLIFIAGFFQAVRNAVCMIRSTNNIEALWPLVYLTFMLLCNLTESTILKHYSIFWVLYVSVAISFYSTHNDQLNYHVEPTSYNKH